MVALPAPVVLALFLCLLPAGAQDANDVACSLDAAALHQRHVSAAHRELSSGPEVALRKAMKNFDPSKMGSLIPRQLTPDEIEGIYQALRKCTTVAKDLPAMVEPAIAALNTDASGHEQVTAKLSTAFGVVQRLVGANYKALNDTYSDINDHSSPTMVMFNSRAEDNIKGLAQAVGKAAEDAQRDVQSSRPTELCNRTSSVLSELRRQSKKFVKACDLVLFTLPPPLPPTNPWVNSTIVEALRSMYTTQKFMSEEVGDKIESGVTSFMKRGAGCEVEIVDLPLEEVVAEKSAAPCTTSSAMFCFLLLGAVVGLL